MSNETRPSDEPKALAALMPQSKTTQEILCWVLIGVLTLYLVYLYLNTLSYVALAWSSDEYSHGYILPFGAALLLFLRRKSLVDVSRSDRLWGLGVGCGLIVFGTLLRLIGARNVIFTFDNISFVPCLMGIFVMVGGIRAILWAGPPVFFLLFMFPLPRFLEEWILHPLQGFATTSAFYALQTMGIEAWQEGNLIHLTNDTLNVVTACSGLNMLTILMALGFAIAMILTNRPLWERIIIFWSALPIALLVNSLRITTTGLMYAVGVERKLVETFFHDVAGLAMPVVALGLLLLFAQLMSWLIVDVEPSEMAPVGSLRPGYFPAAKQQGPPAPGVAKVQRRD